MVLKDFKRIKFFPAQFEKGAQGTIHADMKIYIEEHILEHFNNNSSLPALYSNDERYDQLKCRDVVFIESKNDKQKYMVTAIYNSKIKTLVERNLNVPEFTSIIETQIHKASNNKEIRVYELKRIYEYD